MSQPFSVERIVELLLLCQTLQSEKDGVARPAPGVVDRSKTLDAFAQDVQNATSYVLNLNRLMPMAERLAALGRQLESKGALKLQAGDDIARATLDHLLASYGVPTAGR